MHHHFLKKKRPVTALCMALVLTGCNGDGDSSNSTTTEPQTSASISAQNATFVTDYADRYQVDLSDTVLVSDGDNFTLVDVTSLSATPPCQVLGQSDHSFTIGADSAKSCDYQYRVKLASHRTSANLTDSAITRVAVTRDASGETSAVELNAISATTLVEQTLEVSDIKALLKSQTGFEVDGGFILSDVVTLPYSDHVATVDPATDAISYTPQPGFEGIERILFSYINDETGEVLLGTLDVAVTQEVNSGFVVDDNITHAAVNINEKIEIDVSPYVYSNDGDDYHLVYVGSFNAATTMLNNDVDNKILTFQTSKPGVHHISFAVSDHNGAYVIGLIELYALDPNQSRPWDDIFLGSQRFSAPLTTPETASNGVAYAGGVLDNTYNPPVEVALFTFAQAQAYCGSNGRLPTSSELQSLRGLGVQSDYDWPLSGSYLASDSGVGVIVDLDSGVSSDYSNGGYIVTCVSVGGLTLLTGESSYTNIVANGADKAKIVAQLTFDGEPAEGQILDMSVPSSASAFSIEDSRIETDENGKATFYISSLIAQSFLATIEFHEMEVGAGVSFVGDVKNAVLTQETVTNNEIYGNYNRVLTTLEDVYGNAIADQQVVISGSNVKINGTANSATATTDSNGQIQSSIGWNGSALSVSRSVSIQSSWGGQTDSSTVTFTAPAIALSTVTNNVAYGSANQVKVKLTNSFGQALSNYNVTISGNSNISIDGSQSSKTGTTNSYGEWSPLIRWVGSSQSSNQTVTLTARYGGKTASTTVTFIQPNHYVQTLVTTSDNASFDGVNKVRYKLTNNGEPVAGAHIIMNTSTNSANQVYINGQGNRLYGYTDSNGEWNANLTWVHGYVPPTSSSRTAKINATWWENSDFNPYPVQTTVTFNP